MADVMKFEEVKGLDGATIDAKVSEAKRDLFKLKMEISLALHCCPCWVRSHQGDSLNNCRTAGSVSE
jgi:hypothetical protein